MAVVDGHRVDGRVVSLHLTHQGTSLHGPELERSGPAATDHRLRSGKEATEKKHRLVKDQNLTHLTHVASNYSKPPKDCKLNHAIARGTNKVVVNLAYPSLA